MEEIDSFIDVSLPNPNKSRNKIFIAYSYRLYGTPDYRKVFKTVGKAFSVEFIFADEKISSLHIMQKIVNLIRECRFGIYDISAWNPNVTLELGLALGMSEKVFIALDPSKTETTDVPSDLRGVDRIEYKSYSELEEKLTKLVGQEIPPKIDPESENFIDKLRTNVRNLINQSDGLRVIDLSEALGVSTDLIKVALKPIMDKEFSTAGAKKQTRYYPKKKRKTV
jgi:predicted nucleotide-binding protein